MTMRCSRRRQPGDPQRRQQGSGRDRRGALDVVVEGAEAIAVALEQTSGIGAGEILPLQQHVRPARVDRRDECVDEIIVVLAADALMAPADIERIGEALGIVGAGVEQDRQRRRRMQTGAGGVERELADRDAHAARTLVAKTENALAVADHDRLDPVEARMGENVLGSDRGAASSGTGRAASTRPG